MGEGVWRGRTAWGAPPGEGTWGWEVVSTQDGLLEETALCLVHAPPQKKKSPPWFESLPCPHDLCQENPGEGSEVNGASPSIPVCGGAKW